MKDFYNSFSNRTRAIYLAWVFLHFFLLLFEGGRRYFSNSGIFPLNTTYYNFSSFLFYAITPIFVIIILRLWKKDRLTRISKTVSDEPLQTDKPLSSSTAASVNPDIDKLILCTEITIDKISAIFKITKEREVELYLFTQWITYWEALYHHIEVNLVEEAFNKNDLLWITKKNIPLDYGPVLSQKRKARFQQYDEYKLVPISNFTDFTNFRYTMVTNSTGFTSTKLGSNEYKTEFIKEVTLNLFGENIEYTTPKMSQQLLTVLGEITIIQTAILLKKEFTNIREEKKIFSSEKMNILAKNFLKDIYSKIELDMNINETQNENKITATILGNKTKTKVDSNLFSGGDGTAEQKAVIIKATSSLVGIPAEYEFIEAKYGTKDIGWILQEQMQYDNNSKNYDMIEIKLSNGTIKRYYFDITNFFGKF